MAEWYESYDPIKPGENSNWADAYAPVAAEKRNTSALDTLYAGAKNTARAVGATVDLHQGDRQELTAAAAASTAGQATEDADLTKLKQDIASRKESLGDDPGWIDTAKALGGAVANNPRGSGLMLLEQLPNSGAALAGGFAGMKAGGFAGSFAGPVGGVVGAAVGGVVGMFGANYALEAGNKAVEAAQNGDLSDARLSEIKAEGATKAAVITGVDVATLGLTGKIMGTAQRAVDRAGAKILTESGVDAADRVAVKAALEANPTLKTAVETAEKGAYEAATTLGKKAAQSGAAISLETLGEGIGEYYGEGLSTGNWDKMEAMIEAVSALGQSGAEVAWSSAKAAASPKRNTQAEADQAQKDLSAAGDATQAADAATRIIESSGLDQDIAALADAASQLNGEQQTAAAAAAAPDLTFDDRFAAVKERMDSGSLVSELRAVDPGLPQQFLADYQIARNDKLDESQRAAALDRLEPLLSATDQSAVPANDAHIPPWMGQMSEEKLAETLVNAPDADLGRAIAGGNFTGDRLDVLEGLMNQHLAALTDAQLMDLPNANIASIELGRRNDEKLNVPSLADLSGETRTPLSSAQAFAAAEASGEFSQAPTAMGSAFAGARPDVQSVRNQGATQRQVLIKQARTGAQTTAQTLADNEAGQFSRTRPQTIQGQRVDSLAESHLQELADNPAVSAVVRRSASVELAARRESSQQAETQPASSAQAPGAVNGQEETTQEVLTTGSGLIGLTPAAQMPITELQRYAKSRGRVGDVARAEIAKRSAPAPQPASEAPIAEPTGNADLDTARAALASDGQDVSGLQIVQDSGADIATTGDKATKQESKIVKILATVFKKRVVTLSGLKDDGFVVKSDRNAIYLNANAEQNSIAVFGHEITHLLKTEYPAIYNALAAMVKANFKDMAAFREYYGDTKMSDEALLEEAVSDLVGNRMLEESFWTNTFAKLNALEDKKAPGIIQKFVDALLTVIRRFKMLAGSRKGFETDKWVENLDQIKVAAEDALAQYLHNIRTGAEPTAVGPDDAGITFSSPKRPDFTNQTLPTRWPTGKKLDPAPSVHDDMITDLATLKLDPVQYGKAVSAVLEDPGMHSPEMATGTVDEKAEKIIERMKDNLLWLHDQIPEAIRERSKLWYDGARKIAESWAERYEISESQAAGALAVLSPQKDWFMNVTMAERVLDIIHTKMGHRFDARMDAAAFGFLTKESIKDDPDSQKNLKAYEAVKGKTLKQVAAHHDLRQMSVWIRAYDEAYHDAKHAIVTPEGGFVEDKTTKSGDATMRAWGDFITPGKAASIYLDGTPENINKMLGAEHKVRNFYNNIYAPKDARFLTADTHAVAANELRPLAGADKPVAENFGKTGGTNVTGLSGTYALHYEAYRRAAEARGLLPREMQSITWEAVRGLFTEGYKGKKENIAAIDSIWSQVDAGELSIDDARQRIIGHAGGIENPDWWNEGNAGYKEVLRDKTYVQQRGGFAGAKVTFEVAPDPRNKALKARWDALPASDKSEISHKVAWKIAAKALAQFGDENMKGELHGQLGGWLADTNPSLSIWFNKRAAATKINDLARILGYALNQMGMMRTSPRSFKTSSGAKAQQVGAIIVEIPSGFSAEQTHELYTEIRTITGKRNKPFVSGHTTADGAMILINDEVDSGISNEDLAQRVGDRMFGRHKVHLDTIYAEFPRKGKDSYGLRPKSKEDLGNSAESSLRARSDQLRLESGVLLDQLIGEVERRSDGASGSGLRKSNARITYGQAREGAVEVEGLHFSQEKRATLDANRYGEGLPGAETGRLGRDSADPEQHKRIHFYVNEGAGVTAEAGVGYHAHTVKLNNLYDWEADPKGYGDQARAEYDDPNDRFNYVEQMAVKNGFDGIYVRKAQGDQGVAVLLGEHTVPVDYLGMGKQTTEVSPAMAPKSDTKLAFEAQQQSVMANNSLPGGELAGASWKRMMPRLMPEIDVSHLQDDQRYYKDGLVKRPGATLASTKRNAEGAAQRQQALSEAEDEADRWKQLYACMGKAA